MASVQHHRPVRTWILSALIGAAMTAMASTSHAAAFTLSDNQLDSVTAGAVKQRVSAQASARGALPIAVTVTKSNTLGTQLAPSGGKLAGAVGIGVAYACCESSRTNVDIESAVSGRRVLDRDRSRTTKTSSGSSLTVRVRVVLAIQP